MKNLPESMARATESIINLEDCCWQFVGEIEAAFGLAQQGNWEPGYQSNGNTLPGAMQALAVSLDAITAITAAAADVMGSTGLTRAGQPRTPEATQEYDTIYGKIPAGSSRDITPATPQAATKEATPQKTTEAVPLRVQLDPPGDDGVDTYEQNESGEWVPVESATSPAAATGTHESTPINGHDSPGSVRVYHLPPASADPLGLVDPVKPVVEQPAEARGRERRSSSNGKKKKGR